MSTEDTTPAAICLCIAYDDGWMDCQAHPTPHSLRENGTRTLCPHRGHAASVDDDWICSACGSDVMFEGRPI